MASFLAFSFGIRFFLSLTFASFYPLCVFFLPLFMLASSSLCRFSLLSLQNERFFHLLRFSPQIFCGGLFLAFKQPLTLFVRFLCLTLFWPIRFNYSLFWSLLRFAYFFWIFWGLLPICVFFLLLFFLYYKKFGNLRFRFVPNKVGKRGVNVSDVVLGCDVKWWNKMVGAGSGKDV